VVLWTWFMFSAALARRWPSGNFHAQVFDPSCLPVGDVSNMMAPA